MTKLNWAFRKMPRRHGKNAPIADPANPVISMRGTYQWKFVMDEDVSHRLIEQRLRNRMIEAIGVLARGNEGLIEFKYNEFFLKFYDLWDEGRLIVWPNSAFTEEEEDAINALGRMLDDIMEETLHFQSEAEYLRSGCPKRVPGALRARP
ncbi:hypothetical protein KX729_32760 [Rhizobium sp. XQZ8]|uniref:hypothetical protein n=1 Tax=Rhizobium populisoli TaxID=2859785 RepID=UPI001CA530E0|nr:hypothetical protein [Rhizobium populisoli]MBW6426131.1 hypothetical protein [Rhizobium populisoli]